VRSIQFSSTSQQTDRSQKMNLQEFKSYIKTINVEQIDAIFDEISEKMKRALSPQVKLGYAMALDELVIEKNLKLNPVDNVSVDELYADFLADGFGS
jgi:L-cysteine desulfidase